VVFPSSQSSSLRSVTIHRGFSLEPACDRPDLLSRLRKIQALFPRIRLGYWSIESEVEQFVFCGSTTPLALELQKIKVEHCALVAIYFPRVNDPWLVLQTINLKPLELATLQYTRLILGL
jgi:hypothetical protein